MRRKKSYYFLSDEGIRKFEACSEFTSLTEDERSIILEYFITAFAGANLVDLDAQPERLDRIILENVRPEAQADLRNAMRKVLSTAYPGE